MFHGNIQHEELLFGHGALVFFNEVLGGGGRVSSGLLGVFAHCNDIVILY